MGLQGADGNGGKNGDLESLETGLKDKCWAQKKKHVARLQGGFKGYRDKSQNFKTKVLQEQTSNKASLLTLADLEKKAESVFESTPTTEALIQAITKRLWRFNYRATL